MQTAIAEARKRPSDVIDVVGRAATRDEAIANLAEMFDIDDSLAAGLLELRVEDFLGRLRG
jgi:hypothetical protein